MNRKFKFLICSLFVSSVVFATGFLPSKQTKSIDFTRDIQPIFAAHCLGCHGAKKAAGQLRLDEKSFALTGGMSGAVIIPRDSKNSLLLARVTGSDGQAKMPMGGAPLSPAQINLLQQWIDEGAVWEDGTNGKADNRTAGQPDNQNSALRTPHSALPQHWAYVKPVRPPIPAVKNAAWVKNPIDAFVLARLEKEGLQPSPEATKETLLRRVYLDLIGLPPSVQEIDEFLADNTANAYEKVVDKLLASPHYGERWARPWLDLARYADSNGYEKDRPRVMFKYRDWVINALNEDKPFDQFTIEQLAGDMLPNANIAQKIASGFHRNTLLNQEGGVDDEEARFEILIDRVNTTATVWLGSTLGCAQCHNHKYDPFSQKDYYKLMAFFDNHEYYISSFGNSEGWVVEPEVEMPTPEQAAKRQAIKDEIATIENKIKAETSEAILAQTKWEQEQIDEIKNWTTIDPQNFAGSNGTTFTKLPDKSLLAQGANPEREEYVITAAANLRNVTGLRIEILPDANLPRGGPGRDPYGNFVLSKIEISADGKILELAKAKVDNGSFDSDRFLFAPVRTASDDNPGGWQIDATRDADKRMPRQIVIKFDAPLTNANALTIKLKHLAGGVGQGLGRMRFSVTDTNDPLQIVRIPAASRTSLMTPANTRTAKQKTEIAKLFRDLSPQFLPERARLLALQQQLKELKIVTALVMGEKKNYERPATFFHERGAYLATGEKVFADVPTIFAGLPAYAPANRLGLAYWLVDENNPLTARVAVNRAWEQFFGRGIVLTSEDFGTQGEAPSHPELLDWLAVTLRDGSAEFGMQNAEVKIAAPAERLQQRETPHSALRTPHPWSMKQLHRLIVTSATYRQSSVFNPKSKTQNLKSEDPYNRLLARGPRFRVEAEMVRDIGLSVSGLLSNKIGGASVFPVQPDGIWKNPYSNEKWVTSKGEDKYRRSLYTFVRRTSPNPTMTSFDATSREFCTVRRPRTNTPLQSLNLLNDEAALDNARALAKRMLSEGGNDLTAQIIYGFRLCTSRRPQATEISRLQKLYEQELAHYRQAENAALTLNQNQQPAQSDAAAFAARVIVANVLLNLDETLTKE